MRTWIFQGNPITFDIEGYLDICGSVVMWLVRQHATEIRIGDSVFLWRSEGDGEAPGGIIAELEVLEPVIVQIDDPRALPFWKGEGNLSKALKSELRVRLKLIRRAAKREVLKRKWLMEDAVLGDLAILKMAQLTNYAVRESEIPRIRALWDNTGRDWSREESLAGLYAYDQLFGKPISKGPHSLVSNVAQTIGRANGGVYNKVMNFRSMDPRAPQQGLEGASGTDNRVWLEFFDEKLQGLRSSAIQDEYRRLWGETGSPPLAEASRDALQREAIKLESQGLKKLQEEFDRSRVSAELPKRRTASTATFLRDPRVVAITRLRAQYRCEVSGCQNSKFDSSDGTSYIETHHLQMLSEGGADAPENTVAVCANHHRELHYGWERAKLTNQLKEKRGLEAEHDLRVEASLASSVRSL